MHEVLVNRLGGLSLPRKSVVRLTDRPDMTLDVYCGRKTTNQQNDGNDVVEAQRRTAAQKVTQLELTLGQIANFCPVISRNTIVKNSTSVSCIWQSIRLHYGFQSTGAHFIDFNSIKLEPGERPGDLFQRLQSFVEDNLLRADGSLLELKT